MTHSITFRLKSSSYVKTINISGSVVPCKEVQEEIANVLKAPVEEIHVYLAGSSALLHPDEDITAYSVVDVVRQVSSGRPAFRPKSNELKLVATSLPSKHAGKSSTLSVSSVHASRSSKNNSVIDCSVYGSTSEMTEEERLAQIQMDVGLDTGIEEVSSHFRRRGRGGFGHNSNSNMLPGHSNNFDRTGNRFMQPLDSNEESSFRPPPKNYICHNCGKGGHYIQHCPSARGFNKGMRVMSLPIGIPESMLVECTLDDPAPKFITRDRRIVKRRVDAESFSTIPSLQLGTRVSPSDNTTQCRSKREMPSQSSTKVSQLSHSSNKTERSDESSIRNGGLSLEEKLPFHVVNGNLKESEKSVRLDNNDDNNDDSKYRCIVDDVIAQEAMKTPCCGKLLCHTCYNKLVEQAFNSNNHEFATDSYGSTDDMRCPGCSNALILDAVQPALEERQQIAHLQTTRKRTRE